MMNAPWNDTSHSDSDRAQALLADLTLEEKIGQLGSHWHRPEVGEGGGAFAPMSSDFQDEQTSEDAVIANGLGHITRSYGSFVMPTSEALAEMRRLQAKIMEASPHNIPALVHEESLTGFMAPGATTYPAAIAWGATFDEELIRDMARRIGQDMAALGVHHTLAPVLDVVRDYRWGRIEETIGEDPYLIGMLATAYVQGIQESGIAATLKHFAGHAASRAGRNHAPVSIGRRELHDTDLIPFELAVLKGGVRSVMNSYADIDGVPPISDGWLFNELLRGEWGFEGTVVSDYFAVKFLCTMHLAARDAKDAAVQAISAGLDVELPDTDTFTFLKEAVEEGLLDEKIIDRAVLRVLEQKIRAGLLDSDYDPAQAGEVIDLDSAGNRQLAQRIAEESIVLLKNNGVLPLKNPSKIALIGPSATEPRSYLGCYSFTNHVYSKFVDEGTAVNVPTIEAEIRARFTNSEFHTERGADFNGQDRSGIEAAVEAAKASDIVILTVGDKAGLFGDGTSGEGCDVIDSTLPGRQDELVKAVLETGTPTILVMVTGRPYALGEYKDRAAAIVQAFMPGEQGGAALARILSGDVNPSGRLPIGIPGHSGGQPGTYLASQLAWISEGISNLDPKPLFPFGFGLGYSEVQYSNFSISDATTTTAGTVFAEVTVQNTGDRTVKETVQLYLSDPVASIVRPLKRLIGFTKVELAPGESARVKFEVHADRAAFTGRDLRRVIEPGEIILFIGRSSEERVGEGSFELTGEPRYVADRDRVLTTPVTVEKI